MRLIDANKLQTTTTYLGISDTPVEVVKKSVIDNAKTVEAVPLSVIEKITTEIEERATYEGIYLDRADVLEIIDKAVKEYTHENT